MTAPVRLEQADGLTTLTLARPERGNALGPETVEALIEAVQSVSTAASGSAGAHTLVLQAEGRHFCTGLDLSGLADLDDGALLLRLVRIETLLQLVWHAPIRTVAVAQGRAWGAGADLFAACEWRVAAADTTFRFPGARFGIVLGTRRLAERVGAMAAREVTTGGGQWDCAQALALGLASHAQMPALTPPLVDAATAAALRDASREDRRDADLAALVRSAARPGLKQRIEAYRAALER
ncbi:MAG: enoyl-CoA hydratase/isomerase family protein [Aquabacterium sp.]